MSSSRRAPTWVFFVIGVIVIGVMASAWWRFDYLWSHHDERVAQAEGALFSFEIAGLSVLITLGYIYLNQRSLETARSAIDLQQASLQETKRLIDIELKSLTAIQEATNLEREKWNSQLRVEPRFWLQRSGEPEAGFRVSYFSPERGHNPTGVISEVKCYVWNPGQQSFRVRDIAIWSSGDRSLHAERELPDTVVAPHEIEGIDITELLTKILFRISTFAAPLDRYTYTRPSIDVTVSIAIDSWYMNRHNPERFEAYFNVQTDPNVEDLRVIEQRGPFGNG